MEWEAIVSMTVGAMSMLLAAVAIGVALVLYDRTKDVLSQIREQSNLIRDTLTGTQGELLSTVSKIALQKSDNARGDNQAEDSSSVDDKILAGFMQALAVNPDLLVKAMEIGSKEQSRPNRAQRRQG